MEFLKYVSMASELNITLGPVTVCGYDSLARSRTRDLYVTSYMTAHLGEAVLKK